MRATPLSPDRLFSPDPTTRRVARELYARVADLPLVCPHGHVDPRLFADPAATFGSPADLFIIPDHYVTRLLYSQGIPLESLGVSSPLHGEDARGRIDHREVWRLFCGNFHLFRGTPSGLWLRHELESVFGIAGSPCAENADRLYDLLSEKLTLPEFRPRALFERFRIDVLCTTDAASDPLEHHQAMRLSGWKGRVIPTFRPDGVVNLDTPGWRANLDALSAASGVEITSYAAFIRALEARRAFFKSMGAVATDHAALTPLTAELTPGEADAIFQRALAGEAAAGDAVRFTAHMLMEMARMSIEDGLVMQLHPGSLRNHNRQVFERFGPDRGADIPVRTEYTRSLQPLLNKYGNASTGPGRAPGLTLVLFTLDETTYARELAPLAGHYPAVKLGPPWWFHDSPNGMRRYFDRVMETAGLQNTAGFNDDTRAFCSIPARHDVWRRVSADWVAGLAVRGLVTEEEAAEMMVELASGLARRTYHL